MPVERVKKRRQDPVSCQFCRSKKLKCDRQRPCGNCIARDITCERQSPLPIDQGPPESGYDHVSVLARLKRLEDIVLGVNSAAAAAAPADSFESHPYSNNSPSMVDENEDFRNTDINLIEIVFTRDHTSLSWLSDPLIFRIGSIRNGGQPKIRGESSKYIFLPLKEEAMRFVELYSEHIEHLHHVFYRPFVDTLLDKVYSQLSRQQNVEASHVALLLSIFASTSFLWTPTNQDILPFSSTQVAKDYSRIWTKATLDVLDYSKRTAAGSLEDIQASIIVFFMIFNLEGFSARTRSILSSIVGIARDISLHKIDCPRAGGNNKDESQFNHVESEIRRRVWWYVVSTDWQFALIGGPQDGTYNINPKHMAVKLPRNLNDEDLGNEYPNFERPLSTPTPMSYFLQRIRIGELCRMVADTLPFTIISYDHINYQDIISLDEKLQAFLRDLPVFFRLDEQSLTQSAEIHERYPYIKIQLFIIQFQIQGRRCKLHQPFMIRDSLKPHYSYSREVALQSARTLLSVKARLEDDKSRFKSTHLRHCAILQGIFIATFILVVDICFNKTKGQYDQRREEVANACRMLEEAKEQSLVASKFLDSLMEILCRYKIRLRNPKSDSNHHLNEISTPERQFPTPCNSEQMVISHDLEPYESVKASAVQTDPDTLQNNGVGFNFDDIWKNYIEQGSNLELPEWDKLFFDLDSYPM